MESTIEMTKDRALSLLKLYFCRSEYKRKIKANEMESELSLSDKIEKINRCNRDLMAISKELEEFDLGLIKARK